MAQCECTPAMLSALTELKRGVKCPAPLWWPLKSRGWMDNAGNITDKGLEYLNSRGYIDCSSN